MYSKFLLWLIIFGRFILYLIVNFFLYMGSLLYNVLFCIVNICILFYLVEILCFFFFGGMINNLFYLVRK